MNISKRDIEKMLGYYSKGSRPEVLARTVKDLNKAMSRAVIANAMGWKGCSSEFIKRSKELGATDADIAEVERMCDTYELPDEYKSQFDNGPKLEDVSRLRDWFPKLFKVLRDHKVTNIKLRTRKPTRDELEKDNRDGRCWTLAYTVSFDHNGKHYDWDIANHTNEGGGSFGVSAKSPLSVYQGTQQELADKAARVLDNTTESCFISGKSMFEDKVSEYRGYSIYRVSDADKDDFEIWKNGKKVMSCETDKAAEEWIDSQEDAITETVNAILAGKPVREAIFNFKPAVSDNSLKAQDVYSNSSKFQDLLKSFISSFKPGSEYSVQLEFAVDRSDMDSSGASITLGAMGDKVYLEVANLLDGKLSTVRRVSATRLSDACDLFKSLVDQAESNEFDENNIVVTIISDGTEKRLEMPNPSYKLAKAANESVSINADVESKLKDLETDDYQHRGGNYPESGEPDTIDVWKNTATFTFKNTSEDRARNWVSRFLTKKGFSVDKIDSNQTGDYEDDWVDVYAEIGGLIESQHLKESRKFVKGEKFTFTDKYGAKHECTVLDKELFDEMDYDDYAIGIMTYSYPTLGKPHEETVRLYKEDFGDEYFVSGVSSTGGKSGFGIRHIVKP